MIQGQHVILKPTEPQEWDAVYGILCQPGILCNLLPNPHEVTRLNALEKLGVVGDSTLRMYTILAAEEVVGMEMLARIDPVHRNAVIPCIAIDRKHKGKGLGADATLALVRYAFRWLNLKRVWYPTLVSIEQATARADKLGAHYEGTDKCAYYRDGGWVDRHRFAFIRED